VHKIDKLLNQTIKNCTKIRKKRKEEEIKLIAIKGAQEFVAGE
jgi:small nuclear ribonucleoprotein (snRNP)-like protein